MKLLKTALLALLPLLILYPQYSRSDRELVKTTFSREFDRSEIRNYFESGNQKKVKAALFSIANSEDTTWAPEIVKLNFEEYGKEICFALGELGACRASSDFLYYKLANGKLSPALIHDAITAIGKTGSKEDYEKIIRLYTALKPSGMPGISFSMYYFNSRGLAEKNSAFSIIINDLKNNPLPSQRNFEAAFALFRLTVPDSAKDFITGELKLLLSPANSNKKYSAEAAAYLLGCMRKLHYLPDDIMFFRKLLKVKNFALKVSAVQSLIYFPFNNRVQLDEYLSLLRDSNRNIGRTAAVALQGIKLSGTLNDYLKQKIFKNIRDNKNDQLIRDELFRSYIKLYPGTYENQINNFGNFISTACLYDACAGFDTSASALNFLLDNYNKESNKNKINILQSLTELQDKFPSDGRISGIILRAINSDYAPLIAIAADGIDSALILEHIKDLKEIIPVQVEKHKNNPDYQESITSLIGLSQKVDTSLYKLILNLLTKSDCYSIKKFAITNMGGSPLSVLKDTVNFSRLWQNAFKFKKAEIFTSKGAFTIEFLPGYAPVTTGSFIFLSEKNIFNGNIFHRVVPGFVIQGGDPDETGWGGPGYDINSEFSTLEYSEGMVGMASAGKDTEGSQWFVTTGNYPHLNGRYTIFARVISGLKTVERIEQNDKILRVKFH